MLGMCHFMKQVLKKKADAMDMGLAHQSSVNGRMMGAMAANASAMTQICIRVSCAAQHTMLSTYSQANRVCLRQPSTAYNQIVNSPASASASLSEL